MVEILALGPLSLQKTLLATLVRHANRVQNHFRVFVGDPIGGLGLPDASGEYEAATLGRLLSERRRTTHSDVVIGILDLPLREELFSAVDESSQTVVVSLTNIADTLQRTRRTPADYVLVEIAAQLLAIEYRRLVELKPDPEDCALPWHRETRACVFDYCDNRADTGKKLMEPKLCDHCRAVLGDAHVRQSVIDASVGMVRSAVAPRIIAILWELSGNPIAQMLLGGWLFSIVMMIVDVKRWPIWIPVALMAVVTVVVIGLRYIRGRPRGL